MDLIKRHRFLFCAVILSLVTYIIFYGPFLTADHYFWGSDAQIEYVPARVYFYEKVIQEHSFPFWTEKMYSGFPIYADLENSYLHPVNDASILLFGPRLSYKILHILEYLLGSISLYYLLKRKGIGIWGYAVTNVIYYFNTFSIDHQIHFNVIMAFYLIPTAFLLADVFIEKRKLRYIFLQSLVVANAVLWGHMQSSIIVLLGISLYMAVFSFRKMKISTFVFYFIFLMLIVTALTLPQVLPSYDFFKGSSRETSLDYLKGSLTPQMSIFTFVPYLLNGYEHFIGKKIDKGFTYTEIYMYLGISSVFLSALALLLLKKTREVILAYVFIWFFLIFGFLSYNSFFPSSTPVVTLFRNWERTMALASFGVALLAGILVERLRKMSLNNIKTGIFFIFLPLAYLWTLYWSHKGKGLVKKISHYTSFEYIQNYPYFHALLVIFLILAGIFLAYFLVKKFFPAVFFKSLWPLKIIITVIIFFDLIYFNQDVLAFRLQDISNYRIESAPEELAGKRVVLAKSIDGMETVYYSTWSLYGYSQFKEKEYEEHFKKLGLGDIKYSRPVTPAVDNQKLKDAGIFAIEKTSGIDYLSVNKLDLIKNDLDGRYIEKKEGRIAMEINNPNDGIIGTYLRYNPNWKVEVDGREANVIKNGIFFDFPLKQGNHLVEIYYYPRPFYVGLVSSFLLGIFIILLVFIFKDKIYRYILD